jgi:hypothetical protein
VGLDDKGEEYLGNFLQVASLQKMRGEVAHWYWREDDEFVSAHDPKEVLTLNGVHYCRYADAVAAQFEMSWQKMQNQQKKDKNKGTFKNTSEASTAPATTTKAPLPSQAVVGSSLDTGTWRVDVDVKGMIKSVEGEEKPHNPDSGTKYSVDLARMKQTNAKTKFERDVVRQVEKIDGGGASGASGGGGGSGGSSSRAIKRQNSPLHDHGEGEEKESDNGKMPVSPRFLTTQLSLDDADSAGLHADIPKFPKDLVDQRTGDMKEPLLRARAGQLIQVQAVRDDGWSCKVTCGYLLFPNPLKLIEIDPSIHPSSQPFIHSSVHPT